MNIYHHHTIRFLDASSNPNGTALGPDTSPPQEKYSSSKQFERLCILLHLASMVVGPFLTNLASRTPRGKQDSTASAPAAAGPAVPQRAENSSAKPANNLIAELFLQAHESGAKDNAADAKPIA